MHVDLHDIVPDPSWQRRATLRAMSSSLPDGERGTTPEALERAAEWLDFAVRNRVGPIVAHALRDLLPSTNEARARAIEIHDAEAARMRVLMGEMDRIAERLSSDGIALLALKNAGISRGIYDCAACCPMGDIDTLVERDRFMDAHELMLECGYALASRSAVVDPADLEHGFASGGCEYLLEVNGHEVWVEVQWRPIAGRWIRPDQEPLAADLIARSVGIEGTSVRLLSPADNMIQVSLHTAKHSYVRAPGLRLHTDVDRLARFTPPDWNAVTDMATELTTRHSIYFSLAFARALLDSHVPTDALDRLVPAAWKRRLMCRLMRQVDVFEPNDKKFSRPGMMFFHALMYDDARGLAASALDTDPESVMSLRQLPRNLRKGAHRISDIVRRYDR